MNAVSVKWMGINGLAFRYPGGSFLIDPYVSRDMKQLTAREEVDRYIDVKPDFVLMTHSHWDHLPDMPRIIERTGTVLYASKTACNIMRSLGVPEKNLHELTYGETLEFPGGVKVTALEARHMEPVVYDTYAAPPPPERLRERSGWVCGEVFAFRIEVGGLCLLNAGSANLYEPATKGIECDYFFCGISRWKPGFPELIQRSVRFRRLIPTHHDEFTRPLSEFSLRNDLIRLKEAIPGLNDLELPVLQWVELTKPGI